MNIMYVIAYLERLGVKITDRDITNEGVHYLYARGLHNRFKKLSKEEIDNLEYHMKTYLHVVLVRTIGKCVLWEERLDGKVF